MVLITNVMVFPNVPCFLAWVYAKNKSFKKSFISVNTFVLQVGKLADWICMTRQAGFRVSGGGWGSEWV